MWLNVSVESHRTLHAWRNSQQSPRNPPPRGESSETTVARGGARYSVHHFCFFCLVFDPTVQPTEKPFTSQFSNVFNYQWENFFPFHSNSLKKIVKKNFRWIIPIELTAQDFADQKRSTQNVFVLDFQFGAINIPRRPEKTRFWDGMNLVRWVCVGFLPRWTYQPQTSTVCFLLGIQTHCSKIFGRSVLDRRPKSPCSERKIP